MYDVLRAGCFVLRAVLSAECYVLVRVLSAKCCVPGAVVCRRLNAEG